MLLKSQKRFALCAILAILSFALVIEGASLSQANAQSSPITYSGSFTFSTDLIIAESTDFLPLQQHRTCTISASFQELTLTYADYVGGLQGRVEVNADWSGDWSITPPSSIKSYNDGTSVTRTVTPSSGHVSGTLDVYLNAQLVNGKLAFTFTPYPEGHSSVFFLDELHGSVVTPQSAISKTAQSKMSSNSCMTLTLATNKHCRKHQRLTWHLKMSYSAAPPR